MSGAVFCLCLFHGATMSSDLELVSRPLGASISSRGRRREILQAEALSDGARGPRVEAERGGRDGEGGLPIASYSFR